MIPKSIASLCSLNILMNIQDLKLSPCSDRSKFILNNELQKYFLRLQARRQKTITAHHISYDFESTESAISS